jgi:hypothetical protein
MMKMNHNNLNNPGIKLINKKKMIGVMKKNFLSPMIAFIMNFNKTSVVMLQRQETRKIMMPSKKETATQNTLVVIPKILNTNKTPLTTPPTTKKLKRTQTKKLYEPEKKHAHLLNEYSHNKSVPS